MSSYVHTRHLKTEDMTKYGGTGKAAICPWACLPGVGNFDSLCPWAGLGGGREVFIINFRIKRIKEYLLRSVLGLVMKGIKCNICKNKTTPGKNNN
jgi:hypothetical protein